MKVLGASAFLALVLGVGACGGGSSTAVAPTSADARALLAAMVDMANAADWEALCSLHGGSDLQKQCMVAVDGLPKIPPPFSVIVRAERVLESAPPSAGGRVLSVCVAFGDESVETEAYFVSDADAESGIVVPQPHFWEPRTFSAGGGLAEPNPTPSGSPTVSACG